VTPGEDVSIELTTPGMLTFKEGSHLLSKDRITVIDSLGTCGLSSPSSSVLLPVEGTDIDTWAKWAPWSYFQDAPHEDLQNDVDPAKVVETAFPKAPVRYNVREGMYCKGDGARGGESSNMDLDALTVPMDGVVFNVKDHQCYKKCALEAPCEGDNCFCEGYFSGFDDISSNAICGNRKLCQYLCDNLEDCMSIDMHVNGYRCFLNHVDACGLHQDELALASDKSYNLLIKTTDPNDEQTHAPMRKLQDPAVNVMEDYSWDKMLRFKPLKIATGGTFKVCFCDSTLVPGGVCKSEKDFNVQVGLLHSSGVSCLLEKPSLQRVTCKEQRWGGLRCYQQYSAPDPALVKSAVSFIETAGDGLTGAALSTWCISRPQEAACAGIKGVD